MKFIRRNYLVFLHLTLSLFACALGYPEQGKWNFNIPNGWTVVLTKSLYKGGKFVAKVSCDPPSGHEDMVFEVTWYILKLACWKGYFETEDPVNELPTQVFTTLKNEDKEMNNETIYYKVSSEFHPCDGKDFYLSPNLEKLRSQSDISAARKQEAVRALMNSEEEASFIGPNPDEDDDDITLDGMKRKKRESEPKEPKDTNEASEASAPKPDGNSVVSKSKQEFYYVTADGIYQLILGTSIQPRTFNNQTYSLKVDIDIYNDYGYLSAADYPFLIFYSAMCVVYVIYGVGWLIVSFLRWRELLRVQYWIGAVILLGMLEKAVFTAEYESVNNRGVSVPGLIVFAELVSCAKRTLSRMLVIIVSFGFGIVKPRLGVVLHRVVGVGFLYFVLASIEGCMRALQPKAPSEDYGKRLLFSIVPLAVLESVICWWVFSALVSTTRTLRLRRNTIKLNLFRHFTNTLVFAVVTSVIFMLWSIKYQNLDKCVSDWKQLWVNDAFWHVLFALILLVIMILWRPTNNNQRFAFSPLLDEGSEGEEEEQEKLMANVSDTMKLRGSKTSSNSPRESRSVEDDLKWLEENIPSSITDTGLPVMDSDEEILTTKFEISKMQ
ncbi:UNVERIFIED_CONTAM: hypothetical protein RMT77_013934 [Armadillidium vulgare]